MLVATEVDAELLVVGSSRDEDRFRRLASARGVGDRVHFLGSRSDVARYYRAADILLLPTRADMRATPIEAMAVGIPSIVAGGAGSASVVHDTGASIALSEPFDAQEFRQAVERLARRSVLRRAMGEKGMAAAAAYSTARRGQLVEQDLLAVAEEGSTAQLVPSVKLPSATRVARCRGFFVNSRNRSTSALRKLAVPDGARRSALVAQWDAPRVNSARGSVRRSFGERYGLTRLRLALDDADERVSRRVFRRFSSAVYSTCSNSFELKARSTPRNSNMPRIVSCRRSRKSSVVTTRI